MLAMSRSRARSMCYEPRLRSAVPAESDRLPRSFTGFWLAARARLSKPASGTTITQISGSDSASPESRCPALDEQRRIVDLLEDHLSRLDAADDYLDGLATTT